MITTMFKVMQRIIDPKNQMLKTIQWTKIATKYLQAKIAAAQTLSLKGMESRLPAFGNYSFDFAPSLYLSNVVLIAGISISNPALICTLALSSPVTATGTVAAEMGTLEIVSVPVGDHFCFDAPEGFEFDTVGNFFEVDEDTDAGDRTMAEAFGAPHAVQPGVMSCKKKKKKSTRRSCAIKRHIARIRACRRSF